MGHFKHANLIGGAEAVLHPSENTVREVSLALKVQHRIHNMLQYLRSGNGAVLVHMTHYKNRDTIGFCRVHKNIGALPHLGYGSGRRSHLIVHHGLNGVNDHNVRLFATNGLGNTAHIRLCQNIQAVRSHTQPIGTQLDLIGRLLATHIEDGMVLSQVLTGLQQNGRLADTRIAT